MRLHLVPDLELQPAFDLAAHELSHQYRFIQIPADEDKAALPALVLLPLRVAESAGEEDVDSLENELRLHALHGEDALVAEEVLPQVLDDFLVPFLQKVPV